MRGLVVALIAAAVGLAGCASGVVGNMDMASRIEGWPLLDVRVHLVPVAEMRTACTRIVSMPEACALVDFQRSVCDVYVARDWARVEAVEHEVLHCLGRDHVGSRNLAGSL